MTELDDVTRQLMRVLPQFNRLMAVQLRQEVDEAATLSQFRVLAYLQEQPMSLTALAKMRRVSLQSAGELVQGLVTRGWITRTPNPTDRRQSILELTDEGRVNYERVQQHIQAQLTTYLTLLTEDELQTVQAALTALRRVIHTEEAGDLTDDDR